MNLDEVVKGLARKHTGGAAFFDELDRALQCDDIYARVYGMVKDPHRYTFILTGTFGIQFVRWMQRNEQRYAGNILFPGNLRDGKVKPALYYDIASDRWTDKACFVDDSIYSGTTRATCIHTLYVPKNLPTFVAYDGIPALLPEVRSLYRWHEKEGN